MIRPPTLEEELSGKIFRIGNAFMGDKADKRTSKIIKGEKRVRTEYMASPSLISLAVHRKKTEERVMRPPDT